LNDIWASYRENTKDDFGWQTPFNLGAAVNTPFQDQGPVYFENDDGGVPLLFFGSDRPGGPGLSDIYESQLLSDGSFGLTRLVPELSSPAGDFRPSVRFDGLELFLFSYRPGSLGGQDLWVAMRDTVFSLWSMPTNLGPLVNGTANDIQPHIVSDRQTLYFSSDRSGGFGQADLYVTTRTKQKP
jgi:Tol biopolymer transport system component